MCVRSRSRGVRSPPPWVVWRAHLAWSRHWALVGPFHVVCAPPRVLPRSLAPSGVLRGGRSGPGSPLLGLGLWASPGGVPSTVARGVWGQALPLPRLPAHWAGCWGPRSTCCGRGRAGVGAFLCPLGLQTLWGLRAAGQVRGVRVPGGGLGGGGFAVPPVCAAGGGPVGRGVALPRSVPLPSLGRQQSGCRLHRAVDGGRGPPYHSGSCSPAFSGRDLSGVLARWRGLACSPRPPREPAAWAGVGCAPAPLSGGGGTIPPASGGGGRGILRLAGRWGGGVAPRPPCSPSGWRPAVHNPGPPRVVGATPLRRARAVGVAVPFRAWGGVRGGPWTAPPGAPADLNPPSALPDWAVVTGGPPHTVPLRALLRHAGVGSPRGRDPRGSRSSRIPPPRVAVPSRGGGVPSAPGGAEGRTCGCLAGGGAGGGGRPPALPPHRASACLPLPPACPPRGILVPWGLPGSRGRRARSGRPPTGPCGAGGGGGDPPPWFAPPSSPGRPLIRPLRPRRRRSAVGRQQAGRVGACLGRGAPAPWVQRPLRGVCGAAVHSVCLRPLLGLGRRGGGALVPWRRLLTAGGGAAWRSRPRGPVIGWGVAPFPRPPLPRAGPSWRPSLGPLIPPAVVARRWPAGGGREGEPSAVSGLQGSRFPPALVVSALPPAGGDNLVQMDLKLKPEFVGHKRRKRPYPAPKEQAEEIERQIHESIDAGLVLEYKDGDYPQHCSPRFRVAKPGSTVKRLVVDYGGLNNKTLNHSGSIPNMESTLEKITSCPYKMKMDKRSAFWQVDLTSNAQELLACITPEGRVFKWKVMPFGVANAPALFQ